MNERIELGDPDAWEKESKKLNVLEVVRDYLEIKINQLLSFLTLDESPSGLQSDFAKTDISETKK